MALLERVSTLIRANLNDLIDKAEDPEKMIKQVILDMQNQLLQVKTQVAIAIADQHLLETKQKDNEEKTAEWMRKAELAVGKKDDELARAALHRVESYRELTGNFTEQVADQKAQGIDRQRVEDRSVRSHEAQSPAKRRCRPGEDGARRRRRGRPLLRDGEGRPRRGAAGGAEGEESVVPSALSS